MIDRRLITFLKLCETMSYRAAAAELNLTQPAVTQQIQSLEREYGCELFVYNRRTLRSTEAAAKLAVFARSAIANERALAAELSGASPSPLRAGVTVTIGEYVIGDALVRYLSDESRTLSLTVDNTAALLGMIDAEAIDFALIEGAFDKTRYGFEHYRNEPFLGVCAATHPFAGREVAADELFCETLLLREAGSGTRGVFERMLADRGYTVSRFRRVVSLSDFSLICRLAAAGTGISFVYKAVADSRPDIATFFLAGDPASFEFNFVFLRATRAAELVTAFRSACLI